MAIRPPVPPEDDRDDLDRDAPAGPGAHAGQAPGPGAHADQPPGPGRHAAQRHTPGRHVAGPGGAGASGGAVRPGSGGADGPGPGDEVDVDLDDVDPDDVDLDDDLDGDDLDDVDPTLRPADLTADELRAGTPAGVGEGDAPVHEWCVDKRLAWVKLVLGVLFVAGPWVLSASAASRLVGLVAGAGLVVWGLRDVMAPVRLRVDAAGVRVVSGFAGHRQLRWQDLDRVRLDSRSRLGIHSELLEIDAGESLHFFSRYDLGEPPVDALERLRHLRGFGSR